MQSISISVESLEYLTDFARRRAIDIQDLPEDAGSEVIQLAAIDMDRIDTVLREVHSKKRTEGLGEFVWRSIMADLLVRDQNADPEFTCDMIATALQFGRVGYREMTYSDVKDQFLSWFPLGGIQAKGDYEEEVELIKEMIES